MGWTYGVILVEPMCIYPLIIFSLMKRGDFRETTELTKVGLVVSIVLLLERLS